MIKPTQEELLQAAALLDRLANSGTAILGRAYWSDAASYLGQEAAAAPTGCCAKDANKRAGHERAAD